MPDTTTPETTAQPTTPDAQAGGQPVNWESLARSEEMRRKGLQTTLNREQARLLELQQQADKTIATVTQESLEKDRALKEMQASFEGTKARLAEVEAKAKTAEDGAAKAARQFDRYRAIARKGLVADEEQQLLRTDLEGEDFEKWLDAYSARLGQATQKQALGTTPPGGGSRTPAEPEAAKRARMIQALRAGDMQTYNQLAKELAYPNKGD